MFGGNSHSDCGGGGGGSVEGHIQAVVSFADVCW